MNKLLSTLNTFMGAGIISVLIAYLAEHADPTIAAIMWTYPFTIIIPLYVLHTSNKSNKFISDFVKTQTYALVLLVIVIYAMSYFIEKTPTKDGIIEPLLKASVIWLICAVIFFMIVKSGEFGKKF